MNQVFALRRAAARVGSFTADQWAKAGVLASVALASAGAHAQSTGTGIGSLFDAVDLSGIETKVMALALVIVSIALAFKGPSLVKRVISKI